MLQLGLNLLMAFFACIMVYLTYLLSTSLKYGGAGMFQDLCCLFVRTPALDTFLMFILQSVLAATAVFALGNIISKHIVISFDIIYFISIMMLILYQTFKVFDYLPVIEA